MITNETKQKVAEAIHRVTGYICDEKELRYIIKTALLASGEQP